MKSVLAERIGPLVLSNDGLYAVGGSASGKIYGTCCRELRNGNTSNQRGCVRIRFSSPARERETPTEGKLPGSLFITIIII